MKWYTLQDKSTGRFITRIKKVPNVDGVYSYRTTAGKTGIAIHEYDIEKISNLSEFNVKEYIYKNMQGSKADTRINRDFKVVVLKRYTHKRKITKTTIVSLLFRKKVDIALLMSCDSVQEYNDKTIYIPYLLNGNEFEILKKVGKRY